MMHQPIDRWPTEAEAKAAGPLVEKAAAMVEAARRMLWLLAVVGTVEAFWLGVLLALSIRGG